MKVLQTNGLKAFMASIRDKFISKSDTVEVETISIDNIPTQNSNNLVKSSGVYTAIATKLTEPTSGLAVGKYFRIVSIDENGHAVLECVDAPTAPNAKTGSGAPTTATVADYVGQDYIDTSNNNMIYQCVAIDKTNNLYYWDNVLQDMGSDNTTNISSSISIGTKNVNASVSQELGNNIVIGRNNVRAVSRSIAIGNNCQGFITGFAIGQNCYAYARGIAIGENARAQDAGSIQLGNGTATGNNTFWVRSYRLLNGDGTIPPERLTSQNWTDAQRLAVLLSLGCTVDENGFVKWTDTPSE